MNRIHCGDLFNAAFIVIILLRVTGYGFRQTYSRKCQTLRVPRQNRGFTQENLRFEPGICLHHDILLFRAVSKIGSTVIIANT
jgi:hypothetical protein